MNPFDVVIVGAGNAAHAAALSAREQGAARVLMLEKATEALRGGNTHYSGGLFRIAFDKPEQMLALPEVKSAVLEQGTLRVGVHDLSREAPGVLRWLSENGHPYHHVSSEQPDLETVFLTLTGRSLRDSS